MPPFLPRRRLRSPSPEAGPSKPPAKGKQKAKTASSGLTARKPTLFDDLDAGTGKKRTAEDHKAILEKLAASGDDESSLSSLSEGECEDVPPTKRQKTNNDSNDEDDDIEFEDVETHVASAPAAPPPSGDLELTLTKDTRISITNPFGTKKGPSKVERQIRIATHQVHVQLLMFHNAIRNAWCCDRKLQEILIKELPPRLMEKVEKWRRVSGLQLKEEEAPKATGGGKTKETKGKKTDTRNQRDWGQPAETMVDSDKDPLIDLLKSLVSFWRKRFRITAPGLRKLGYMSLQRLDEESKSFKDKYDPERHGERIKSLEEFREYAKALHGSRDVGAQLFTALFRGLGLEARLVANLQPVGFGWSQAEEASENNPRKLKLPKSREPGDTSSEDEASSNEEENLASKSAKRGNAKTTAKGKTASKGLNKFTRRTPRSGRGCTDIPIVLSESEEAPSSSNDDDLSVVNATLAKRTLPSLPYDRDLLYPHYWTEVLSPVTNTYIAVDALVLHIVANSQIGLEKFEPRGAKADKAKQVTAYIIGHSSDGTAKDVTTRYLKRHLWPGRTKGNRFPVEKVPIYNKYGKVKRYEQRDWFKTVMTGYERGSKRCPRTEIDDHEEATDLKPIKPEKKEVEEGKETLQYYKSSPDFVLERFLKREEALVPTAKHVKMFAVKGKGDAATEEKVFLRKDVVSCKSMETWHKEGRAPKPNEEPLKRVPYRAATTNRRRELAEAENASGEKVLQGLFSRAQTDWIIPPPIENGLIPKNSFGNIDLYVDSMLPEGAVHIPYRGTVKICKRLEIDYAEAVTGFEFGHRMAVPIINGVVVAEEHYDDVMDEWQKDEAERVRKEDEKRSKAAIHMWRKMLMGMRIVARVREEYGDLADGEVDVLKPWSNQYDKDENMDVEAQKRIMDQRDEEIAGGFLPEGFDAEESDEHHHEGFYPATHDGGDDNDGGFFVEEDGLGEQGGFVEKQHDDPIKLAYATPQSLQSAVKPPINEPDEDISMQDAKSEVEAPAPKKRGRSVKKITVLKVKPAITKPKPKAKSATIQKASSKGTRKGKVEVHDPENEEDEFSPLTDLESELESEEVKTVKKAPGENASGRRVALPAKSTSTPRKTPKRNAARKSETALKSHYFKHDKDDDDDDDDE
jgi:xeroderma pigmentosum group C-complementing protein